MIESYCLTILDVQWSSAVPRRFIRHETAIRVRRAGRRVLCY